MVKYFCIMYGLVVGTVISLAFVAQSDFSVFTTLFVVYVLGLFITLAYYTASHIKSVGYRDPIEQLAAGFWWPVYLACLTLTEVYHYAVHFFKEK